MGISEAASENGKARRGRPRLIPAECRKGVEFVAGVNVRTERGRQNVHHALTAISLLDEETGFGWLIDQERIKAGERGLKFGILAELGRFYAAGGDILEAASEICRLKPKTKAAVAMIRGWRLGRQPPGTVDGLSHAMVQAVNQYLAKHPDTPPEVVMQAVYVVKLACQADLEDLVVDPAVDPSH